MDGSTSKSQATQEVVTDSMADKENANTQLHKAKLAGKIVDAQNQMAVDRHLAEHELTTW
jgi:hypothetical protein